MDDLESLLIHFYKGPFRLGKFAYPIGAISCCWLLVSQDLVAESEHQTLI